MGHLKLVSTGQSRTTKSRPIRTEYVGFGYRHSSHSVKVAGALRAAITRIVAGEYRGATIFDELDLVTYEITTRSGHVRINICPR